MSDTASTDLVQGTEFTTEKNVAPAVLAKAYELYLNTDLDITDIAVSLSVPRSAVAAWVRNGKWEARKQELIQELFKSSEDKYRALILANRAPTVERHLRVGKKLEEAIERNIDEATADGGAPSDMRLKRLAESLSSVSSVTARAAGVTDTPFSEGGQKQGKVPLVFVNVQPGVASAAVTVEERPAREDEDVRVSGAAG